jgi:hypothetical protein
MYRVIVPFFDLHDGNHRYSVGDAFPRKGSTATEERLEELAGRKNRLHKPLIEAVRQEDRPKRKTATKSRKGEG